MSVTERARPVTAYRVLEARATSGLDDHRDDHRAAARRRPLSSSAKPRAWISGPPSTLPVTESTTTITEMKPSSPRIRRSFSDASVTSPTLEPST
jgi:hypothetical protein